MKKYLLKIISVNGEYKEYETNSFTMRAVEDGQMHVTLDDFYTFICIEIKEIKVRQTF